MRKNKIMVVSTGRADYGLLYPLIKKITENHRFELQLVATGSHLSPLHGNTIELIEEDSTVHVTDKVEMVPEDDTETAICCSISKGLTGFSLLYSRHSPDLLVVLGDRYELWSVCTPAVIHKIPIAHIHGGEATFGLIDDPIRHSVTKMSAFHFASLDLYAKRIIQMGENPERVFAVGALGIDNIKSIPMMSCEELSGYSGVDFNKDTALMTYHPVTLDPYGNSEKQVEVILEVLLKTGLQVVMTMPNSDTSGNVIYRMISDYSEKHPEKFMLIKNLGQRGYLSAMKYARLMIGNSSSGILESSSFRLPVVNIGDRQAGRYKPGNVIDCACSKKEIAGAVNKALSEEFKKSVSGLVSPYGDGRASERIIKILETINFDEKSKYLKKGFFDLIPDSSQTALRDRI